MAKVSHLNQGLEEARQQATRISKNVPGRRNRTYEGQSRALGGQSARKEPGTARSSHGPT